jgi:hypothetical protein
VKPIYLHPKQKISLVHGSNVLFQVGETIFSAPTAENAKVWVEKLQNASLLVQQQRVHLHQQRDQRLTALQSLHYKKEHWCQSTDIICRKNERHIMETSSALSSNNHNIKALKLQRLQNNKNYSKLAWYTFRFNTSTKDPRMIHGCFFYLHGSQLCSEKILVPPDKLEILPGSSDDDDAYFPCTIIMELRLPQHMGQLLRLEIEPATSDNCDTHIEQLYYSIKSVVVSCKDEKKVAFVPYQQTALYLVLTPRPDKHVDSEEILIDENNAALDMKEGVTIVQHNSQASLSDVEEEDSREGEVNTHPPAYTITLITKHSRQYNPNTERQSSFPKAILLQLTGTQGSTSVLCLKDIQSTSYPLYCSNVGDITSLCIWMELPEGCGNSISVWPWYLSRVELSEYTRDENIKNMVVVKFPCDRWLDEGNEYTACLYPSFVDDDEEEEEQVESVHEEEATAILSPPVVQPPPPPSPPGHYRIVIHTSNRLGASLPKSAKVFIELVGEDGHISTLWLNKGQKAFKRSSVDAYEFLLLPYIGVLKKCRLGFVVAGAAASGAENGLRRRGSSGEGSSRASMFVAGMFPCFNSWRVSTVQVVHKPSGESWQLPCHALIGDKGMWLEPR